MSLLKSWAPHFQSHVRDRGRRFQVGGRVAQLPPEPGEIIRADVSGTETHRVTVASDGRTASAACTCSRHAGGAYCAHIWAALLDAQDKGVADPQRSEFAPGQVAAPKARRRDPARRPERREPDWIGRLSLLAAQRGGSNPPGSLASAIQRQVCYVINVERSGHHTGVVLETWQRTPIPTGWSRLRPFKIDQDTCLMIDDAQDREICAILLGARRFRADEGEPAPAAERPQGAFQLRPGSCRALLRRLAETGRCFLGGDIRGAAPLQWDDDQPWHLWLGGQTEAGELHLDLQLRRDDARLPVAEPLVLVGGPDGVVIYDHRVAPFDDGQAFRWVTQFRDQGRGRRTDAPFRVGAEDVPRFLDRLYLLPQLPELDLPDGLGRPVERVQPTAHLDLFHTDDTGELGGGGQQSQVRAQVWFDYNGSRVRPEQPGTFVTGGGPARDNGGNSAPLMRRDVAFEQEALAQLPAVGFRADPAVDGQSLALPGRRVYDAVRTLADHGWLVYADQRLIRRTGRSRLSIASGVDWFELHGGVEFETAHGHQQVPLPEILAAAREGRQMIALADGSQGLLPTEWLRRHSLLTAMGSVEEGHLRFRISQAALLDALLSQQELARVDETFERARQRLRRFERIEPGHEPESFKGTLRAYQREGLGWMRFMRWLGTGGILADDMGLGKTIQVLAMVAARQRADPAAGARPTLVVVPRSTIFNWVDEAGRFTPDLRVQVYAGAERSALRKAFGQQDLIVTSYGVMRRDIGVLRRCRFDYVVLDEAQAIKNASSQAAKAARLLDGQHRMALTGTPVENHLGDIWSIFEFLNPGMLGSISQFGNLVREGLQDPRSRQAATQAARALRPFILRRTKGQVLKDLPEKTEQTIVCELEPNQRRIYDALLAHYRNSLLGSIQSNRIGQSAMMVLEALLRLRQAACHPGLIDPGHAAEPSAKIEALTAQLTELIAEGHKALVFSQFTSFLALVRTRLEEEGIAYAYLDGQTRDRQAPVKRFQDDAGCPVFLISLKAGGLGLNLTAAEYVFILDPWWNPAVETQAIDRAHRIGQTRPVFAYRLVCRDTVEQRIIELQERKRQLADAIVGGQGGILRNLTQDELKRLLS